MILAACHECRVVAGQPTYRDFFDHIETAAGFPSLGSGLQSSSPSEIRVLNWAPTAMIPMSGLRLVQSGAEIRVQLIVAWHADVSPSVRQPGVTAHCDPGSPATACVELVDVSHLRPPFSASWNALFDALLEMGPCEDPNGPITVTSDAGDLVMRLVTGSGARKYFCNAPRYKRTPAGRQAAALLDYLDESLRRTLGR